MKPDDVSQEAWDDIVDDADRILSAAWRVHDENFNPHSNSISDGLWGKFVTAVARAIMAAKAEEREQILSSLRKLYQACAGEHEAQMAIGDAIDIVTERT